MILSDVARRSTLQRFVFNTIEVPMSKRQMDFARGLKDPVVVRIAQMHEAQRTAKRWISWEEYFPPRPGDAERRAYDHEVIRSSKSKLARALQILDAVCVAAAARGFTTRMGYRCHHLDLIRDEAAVRVRVLERGFRADTTKLAQEDWDRVLDQGVLGSGLLELIIDEYSDQAKRFKDHQDSNVLDRLSDIAAAIETRHVESLERLRRERRRDEAIRQIREEAAAREVERKAEKRRVDVLLKEVRAWNDADLIRRYVQSLDQRHPGDARPAEDYVSWRQWALAKADELDPSSRHFPQQQEP
ncbi:hypothetical protein FEP54_02944 [Burkholderia multivorans]|nr:hypothetical protein [Burkholderia multivorans]MDR8924224.1 hypothetical protein [Burkholderia multivorans]MDR8969174.1 hypothetical protein [Burkholderia multivorans]MDR8993128.1 hypothetical protein [Burkholderia multivorans]MDR9023825.1 hypothetical protein [Burkholderia multivorans]